MTHGFKHGKGKFRPTGKRSSAVSSKDVLGLIQSKEKKDFESWQKWDYLNPRHKSEFTENLIKKAKQNKQ